MLQSALRTVPEVLKPTHLQRALKANEVRNVGGDRFSAWGFQEQSDHFYGVNERMNLYRATSTINQIRSNKQWFSIHRGEVNKHHSVFQQISKAINQIRFN